MADIYSIISIVAFSLAGVFFIASVIIFFKFDIIKIIGDLSGKTAKKSIEQIRGNNDRSGKKYFSPTAINERRGKFTNFMTNSKKLGKTGKTAGSITAGPTTMRENPASMPLNKELTGALVTDKLDMVTIVPSKETEMLKESVVPKETVIPRETAMLNDNGGTALLNNNMTEVLTEEKEQNHNGTAILNSGATEELEPAYKINFRITKEIKFIHTEEVI